MFIFHHRMENKSQPQKIPKYILELEKKLSDFSQELKLYRSKLDEFGKKFEIIEKNTQRIIQKQKQTYEKKPFHKKKGFAKEVCISDDLCKFMSLESGSMIPRTEVTQFLINYIKTHQLVNPNNKKQVVPDESLWELLGQDARQHPKILTHFSLQKYMNRHFLYGTRPSCSENSH